MNYIIGVDEAGRGPLAGPVTVGAFGCETKTAMWILKNLFDNKLRDSKKLGEKKRENIFDELKNLKTKGLVDFSIAHSTPKYIDRFGISKAVKKGIDRCLKNISLTPQPPLQRKGGVGGKKSIQNVEFGPEIFCIKLDGLLKAPSQYKNQETITKGDEKNIHIACASIVAKVARDRLMCRLAKKYPGYGFDIHKGYGTVAHQSAIQRMGLSIQHRATFCKKY